MKTQPVLALLRKQQAKKALIISAEKYFKNWQQGEVVTSGTKRLATANKH